MVDVDDLPCGCLRFDEQRTIVEANGEAARLLGVARDDLVGRRLSAVLPVATRIFFQAYVFPELVERGQVDEMYVSLQTVAGAELPVLLSLRRVGRADGPTYTCVFLPMHRRHLVERDLRHSREVADRATAAEQQALEQVREVQAQLVIQDRLAAIGTLAAGVAHEINNPLTFVAGNLELIAERLAASGLRDAAPQGELRRLLAETVDGLDRIRGIVGSLRSLARPDDGSRGSVDVATAFVAARRLCAHELNGRATVTMDVSSPSPVVEASEGRLVQVLVNLLVNAAHAMPARPEAENRIVLRAHAQANGSARIEVEDNGVGMSPDVQARVFDPYFTTKAGGLGTGLGLSVCHGIVTALGGTMQVASLAGEGTVFRILLPLSAEPHAPAAAVDAPLEVPPVARPGPSAAAAARRRVLVADDEKSITDLIARVLRDYDVTVVFDGAAAVRRLLDDQAFDVVLCDLTMPGLSGMEVHEAVASVSPALARRIVFMTGDTFSERVRRFLDGLPNERIEKPFRLQAIREVCERTIAAHEAGRTSD